MTFDQDKRENEFLKGQERVKRGIRETGKSDLSKSSVNREENDEKV